MNAHGLIFPMEQNRPREANSRNEKFLTMLYRNSHTDCPWQKPQSLRESVPVYKPTGKHMTSFFFFLKNIL